MKRINIGIVGLGNISKMHIAAMTNCPECELLALCSTDDAKLTDFSKKYMVECVYSNYAEMLENKSIDAIVIATPTAYHSRMTILALKAGKHVLCEKPPAMSAEEAEAMAQAASEAKKILMYNLMLRFCDKYQFAHDWVAAGSAGDVYFAKAGIVRRSGFPGGWFHDITISGGGALMDLGPHIIDLAMYVLGKNRVRSVFARTFNKVEGLKNLKAHSCYKSESAKEIDTTNGVEDFAFAVINFDDGSCLEIETSFASHIKEDSTYLTILGSKAGMQFEKDLEIFKVENQCLIDQKLTGDITRFDHQESINALYKHFVGSIMSDTVCSPNESEGVNVMRVIEALYLSARTNRLIEF